MTNFTLNKLLWQCCKDTAAHKWQFVYLRLQTLQYETKFHIDIHKLLGLALCELPSCLFPACSGACPAGQFESQPCSESSDRICSGRCFHLVDKISCNSAAILQIEMLSLVI